mmetsp:Transcript_24939/g.45801  ORF Transcript_24939/g.45801 Transcript_24939/m.45801 type:complete len:286 (-) Transcript_24939:54-911(-)
MVEGSRAFTALIFLACDGLSTVATAHSLERSQTSSNSLPFEKRRLQGNDLPNMTAAAGDGEDDAEDVGAMVVAICGVLGIVGFCCCFAFWFTRYRWAKSQAAASQSEQDLEKVPIQPVSVQPEQTSERPVQEKEVHSPGIQTPPEKQEEYAAARKREEEERQLAANKLAEEERQRHESLAEEAKQGEAKASFGAAGDNQEIGSLALRQTSPVLREAANANEDDTGALKMDKGEQRPAETMEPIRPSSNSMFGACCNTVTGPKASAGDSPPLAVRRKPPKKGGIRL